MKDRVSKFERMCLLNREREREFLYANAPFKIIINVPFLSCLNLLPFHIRFAIQELGQYYDQKNVSD